MCNCRPNRASVVRRGGAADEGRGREDLSREDLDSLPTRAAVTWDFSWRSLQQQRQHVRHAQPRQENKTSGGKLDFDLDQPLTDSEGSSKSLCLLLHPHDSASASSVLSATSIAIIARTFNTNSISQASSNIIKSDDDLSSITRHIFNFSTSQPRQAPNHDDPREDCRH